MLLCLFLVIFLVLFNVSNAEESTFQSVVPNPDLEPWCENPNFTKEVLKSLQDRSIGQFLYNDDFSYAKYEASDVTVVNNEVYVVFDSLWPLGLFQANLNGGSERHLIWPHSNSGINLEDDSQFEGITYDHLNNVFI
eukprot:UN27810